MTPPKVLLFDLGGVIVRWTGIDALMEITGLPRAEVLARFANSEIATAYEIGQCSDDVFTEHMIALFGLPMDAREFQQQWKLWVGTTYPGTKAALTALRSSHMTACLSNTNAMHWERLTDHIITGDYFHHSFASHLIEAAKPDARSYHIPLKAMGVEASDVWFFDDTMVNVHAAIACGMRAYHVDRETGVLPVLKRLGLI